jgi:glucosamine--fructose-6-phosphate aminotransferase (isomerizing)
MTPGPAARGGHPFHMHDAIYAQPGALRLVLRPNAAALAGAAGALRAADTVVLAGAGSSWHAALVGELLLARVGGLGLRARALPAFAAGAYWSAAAGPPGPAAGPPGPAAGPPGAAARPPGDPRRTSAVAISHRGATRGLAETLAHARASGGGTVAVTGKGVVVAGAEHALVTVEPEASGTHTVSYTCALAVLAALAAAVGGDDAVPRELQEIPDYLALLLGQEAWEDLAARFADRRQYHVVGGGPNVATALEGALKLQEAARLSARGADCEEFLHGPWAAMTDADLLIVVAPPGPAHGRCLAAARVAREVGTPVLALVADGDDAIGPLAAETIALPAVDELLSPLLAVVPLQLLAYHLALRRGADPDAVERAGPAHARAHAVLAG